MFPFAIPPGTTLRTLVTDVFPAAHAKLVPRDAGPESFRAVVVFEGDASFTVDLRAGEARVRADEEAPKRDFWLLARARIAREFLDDWMGPQRFVPKFTPPGDLRLLTDPRLLKRLAMVSGKVELALRGFPGDHGPERVAMTVACGAAARHAIVPDDPDVVVEASMDVAEQLLRGAMAPEEALADAHVTVRGKKLVALQLALALHPLFPAR